MILYAFLHLYTNQIIFNIVITKLRCLQNLFTGFLNSANKINIQMNITFFIKHDVVAYFMYEFLKVGEYEMYFCIYDLNRNVKMFTR